MLSYIHFFRPNCNLMIYHGIIADTNGTNNGSDSVWQIQTKSNFTAHPITIPKRTRSNEDTPRARNTISRLNK